MLQQHIQKIEEHNTREKSLIDVKRRAVLKRLGMMASALGFTVLYSKFVIAKPFVFKDRGIESFEISKDGMNFHGLKAIAMVCDNGATLPASPVTAQWFCHTPTGRAVLMIYDGTSAKWIPIISIGTMTLFVDGGSGSDSLDNGGASGASAFATIQFSVDAIPGLVGGSVTIAIAAATYAENLIIEGKSFAGNFNIVLTGTLSSQESGTWSANGVTGTGGTQGSGTDTGSFTGDSYAGLLVQDGGDSAYRIIDSHNNDTLTITGTFDSQPLSGEGWEVFDWGTILTGTFRVQNGQLAVFIFDVKISNTGVTNGALNYSRLHIERCRLDSTWGSNVHCKVQMNIISQTGTIGRPESILATEYSGVELQRCRIKSRGTGGAKTVFVANRSWMKTNRGTILDGQSDSSSVVLVEGMSSWTINDTAVVGYTRVRNGTTGILAQGGSIVTGTPTIQYSGLTTDESPSGASDPAFID